MADGIITNNGLDLVAEIFLGTSSETCPTKFAVGTGTTTPTTSNTQLETPIPIEDGTTINDGADTLTGSNGASDSTDNTTTYRVGGGNTDNTSQNLIASTSSATKTWTITLSTNMTDSSYWGMWVYIKDATELAKFNTSGTCLEVKFGSDSSNYYSKTYEANDLSTGWNWLSGGYDALSDLTETGTVSGNIDTFIIEITTNNATDTFTTGDVLFDLLRQWTDSDLYKDLESTPSYNDTDKAISYSAKLTVDEANGFNISEIILVNDDYTCYSRDVFTAFSKSNTERLEWELRDFFQNT